MIPAKAGIFAFDDPDFQSTSSPLWGGIKGGGGLTRISGLASPLPSDARRWRAKLCLPSPQGGGWRRWSGQMGHYPQRRKSPLDPRQGFMVYPRHWTGLAALPSRRDGRIAQRESTSLTSRGSQVRSLLRPPSLQDFRQWRREYSSAGEHSLHTRRVTSSILVTPTIHLIFDPGRPANGQVLRFRCSRAHARSAPVLGHARFRLAPARS